jgi:hypothetical protein
MHKYAHVSECVLELWKRQTVETTLKNDCLHRVPRCCLTVADSFEDHVERCEQYYDTGAIYEITSDADPKQPFVREDISGRFRRIMCNNQVLVYTKIDGYHDCKRD